ncbi:unknown [Ruminococcus sp. CAG:9]|nr:unknown [Ruminococcus sp. CAG:9]
MFFFDIFYISDNDTFAFGKRIIPPLYYVHIDILQSVYLRNYSLCTPFIRIVCAMSFFTIFENIYSVRTDMSAEKADKFINLLVRCMVIECRSKCFIYDQFILYDCLHMCFLYIFSLYVIIVFLVNNHRFNRWLFISSPSDSQNSRYLNLFFRFTEIKISTIFHSHMYLIQYVFG